MKILLATDGSIEADLAETVLTRIAPLGAEITVAMVVPSPQISAVPLGLTDENEYLGTARHQRLIAERTVEQVSGRLADAGYQARPLVLQGDVATELLNVAREESVDLVAAGSSIDSNLQALLLGSVSRKLALYSESSVLIARRFRKEPVEGSVQRLVSKAHLDVLVAVDPMAESGAAVESLAALPKPMFGRLFVLAVAPDGGPAGGGEEGGVAALRGSEAHAFAVAESLAERLHGAADQVVAISGSGRPSNAIVSESLERDVDLIAMAASRHGALERWMVGSCAYETVTHAACAVLILRKPLKLQ